MLENNPDKKTDSEAPINHQKYKVIKLFLFLIINIGVVVIITFTVVTIYKSFWNLGNHVKTTKKDTNTLKQIPMGNDSGYYYINYQGNEMHTNEGSSNEDSLYLYFESHMKDFHYFEYEPIKIKNPQFVLARDLLGEFVHIQGNLVKENEETVLEITSLEKDNLLWQTPVDAGIKNIATVHKLSFLSTGTHSTLYKGINSMSYTCTRNNFKSDSDKDMVCETDSTVMSGINNIFIHTDNMFFEINRDSDDLVTLYGPLFIMELDTGKLIRVYKTDLIYYAILKEDLYKSNDFEKITTKSYHLDNLVYANVDETIFISKDFAPVVEYFSELFEEMNDEECVNLSQKYGGNLNCVDYDANTWNDVINNRKCTTERALLSNKGIEAVRNDDIINLSPIKPAQSFENTFTSIYGYTIKYPDNWSVAEKELFLDENTSIKIARFTKNDVEISDDPYRKTFFDLGSWQTFSSSGALCANSTCLYGGNIQLGLIKVPLKKLYSPTDSDMQNLKLSEYRFTTSIEKIQILGTPLGITGAFLNKEEGFEIVNILDTLSY